MGNRFKQWFLHTIKRRKTKGLIVCVMILFVAVVAFVDFNPSDDEIWIDGVQSEIQSEEPTAPIEEVELPEAEQPLQNTTQRFFEITRPERTFYPLRDDDMRIIYLTFDDGPSHNVTPEILRILREQNVRATFFVLGSEVERYPELVRQMLDEGHTIANHTFTHKYREIYASSQALLAEIQRAQEAINAALGFDYGNRIFRFPGGSHDKRAELRNAVIDAGFQFVDWNAGGNDSVSARSISADLIFQNTVKSAQVANAAGQFQLTLLFHDNNTKMSTAEALPRIIEHFRNEGYEFRTLCEM